MDSDVLPVFTYYRGIGPMVGVLLALGLVETFGVHIIAMGLWGWKVALPLGLVDLAMIASLAALLHSFQTKPITIEGDMVVMRTGFRLSARIPIADIAGFREQWTMAEVKAPTTLNMALIAWPNIAIELRRPMSRRRKTVALVVHKLDDPAAFRAAVTSRMSA